MTSSVMTLQKIFVKDIMKHTHTHIYINFSNMIDYFPSFLVASLSDSPRLILSFTDC